MDVVVNGGIDLFYFRRLPRRRIISKDAQIMKMKA